MNIADLYLREIGRAGIDTVFTVYGGAMSELADAFTRQSAVRYVCTQHEQGAIFSAEGYAKASGKPGCVIVTSGPGVGNIMTGLQNCFYDSVPLLAICGQVATTVMRQDKRLRQRGFQETEAADMARSVTKAVYAPRDTDSAVLSIKSAIKVCASLRPGPVMIDLPVDIQRAPYAD